MLLCWMYKYNCWQTINVNVVCTTYFCCLHVAKRAITWFTIICVFLSNSSDSTCYHSHYYSFSSFTLVLNVFWFILLTACLVFFSPSLTHKHMLNTPVYIRFDTMQHNSFFSPVDVSAVFVCVCVCVCVCVHPRWRSTCVLVLNGSSWTAEELNLFF